MDACKGGHLSPPLLTAPGTRDTEDAAFYLILTSMIARRTMTTSVTLKPKLGSEQTAQEMERALPEGRRVRSCCSPVGDGRGCQPMTILWAVLSTYFNWQLMVSRQFSDALCFQSASWREGRAELLRGKSRMPSGQPVAKLVGEVVGGSNKNTMSRTTALINCMTTKTTPPIHDVACFAVWASRPLLLCRCSLLLSVCIMCESHQLGQGFQYALCVLTRTSPGW